MVNLSMSTTDDCRFLQGQYSGSNPGPATLVISNNGSVVATYSISILLSADGEIPIPQNFVYSIPEIIGENPGVITAVITDFEGQIVNAGALSSFFLDCCLADKTLELTECNCGEPQCDKTLMEAQRLFLLIQSVNTLLANIPSDASIASGVIQKAVDAYNSAKTQCTSFCGCNC